MPTRKGLTLIELMIIVSIIGIILAIGLPLIIGPDAPSAVKYGRYKLQNGEVVECQWSSYRNAGMDLYGCRDGNKYNAMTNVVVLP
jgi:prepilin-type N-terminal cleavage/methylation domain-containing protein